MTPRFAAILAALVLAYLAYSKPGQVGEALGKWYAMLTDKPPPVEINAVVAWAPKVLVAGVVVVLLISLILFTRKSYGEFRTGRKFSQGKVIKEARKMAKKPPADPLPIESHKHGWHR